ncbi:MAG TPA: CHAD domain-containing protein [Rhizomicrobium sp.]
MSQARIQQFELNLDAPYMGVSTGRALTLVPPPQRKPRTSALPPRPQKAQRALVPADATALDAFRLTIVQCRWHIAANEAATVEAHQAEGLHQMRVAMRRLRVALAAFGDDFRTPHTEAIALKAKDLAGRLGPARDLDVFLDHLFETPARANGAQHAFARLRSRMKEARAGAWGDAVAELRGMHFRAFMHDLTELVDRDLPFAVGRSATGGAAFSQPARHLAQRMLDHRYRKACKRARTLDSSSENERHAFRISLKKLRYTAEFFAPFFEAGRVAKFVSRLSGMQDVLGALNDVAVARKILDALVLSPNASGIDAELGFAAGAIYGWHLQSAAHKWGETLGRWKKLARTRPFWDGAPAH